MFKLKKALCTALCLSFFFSAVLADNKGAGTTLFHFMKMPFSASQAALAGIAAFHSSSAAVNPAMINFVPKPQISASYAVHFQDTSYNSFSFTMPFRTFGLNIAYSGFNYGDIDSYIEDSGGGYLSNGTFTANEAFVSAAFGFNVNNEISAGAVFKYIWQSIDDSDLAGFAFSASAIYMKEYEDWYVSGGVENAGPDIDGYRLPASAFISYMQSYREFLVFGFELKGFIDESIWLKAAAEFTYEEMLFFRCGYNIPVTNDNSALGDWYEKNLSLGFGIEYGFFALDYGWLPFGELGSTNIVSVNILF